MQAPTNYPSMGPEYRRSAGCAFVMGLVLVGAPIVVWVLSPQLHDTTMSTIIDGLIALVVVVFGLSQIAKAVRLRNFGAEADEEAARKTDDA